MTKTKIQDLSIGPYDQVMAYTQELINVGFKTLWERNPSGRIDSIGNHEVSFEKFIFGAPKIVIRYRSDAPNYVVLRLNIATGTLKYWKNESDKKQSRLAISNWYLAFPVDLGLDKVPDKELPDLKTKIEVPGDYSVSRLMYDLTTISSGELDPSLSAFHPDLTPAHIKTLIGAINTPEFMAAEHRTLGYLLHDDSHAATFKPSSMKFQTYPWCDASDTDVGQGIDGNHILNYLCYNEMTEGRAPPATNVYLPWTSNFTTGDASAMDDSQIDLGTFVMSKDNFWNKWLIPQLKYINMCVHYKVWDQSCDAWGANNYRWGAKKQVAADGSEMPDADWISKESRDIFGNLIWTWTVNYDPDDVSAQSGLMIGIAGSMYAHNTSEVKFIPGTGQINISGVTEVHEYCEVWRGLIHYAHSDADRVTRRLNWSFDLNLVSVLSGGLQVQMSNISTTWNHVQDQCDLNYNSGSFWDSNSQNVENQLANFEQYIANGLNDLHKMYYPAGGMIYYNNPVFAHNGDLQTSVRLNPDAIPGQDRNLDGVKAADPPKSDGKKVKMADDPKKTGTIPT